MKMKATAFVILVTGYSLGGVAGALVGPAWAGDYHLSIAVIVGIASVLAALSAFQILRAAIVRVK